MDLTEVVHFFHRTISCFFGWSNAFDLDSQLRRFFFFGSEKENE